MSAARSHCSRVFTMANNAVVIDFRSHFIVFPDHKIIVRRQSPPESLQPITLICLLLLKAADIYNTVQISELILAADSIGRLPCAQDPIQCRFDPSELSSMPIL